MLRIIRSMVKRCVALLVLLFLFCFNFSGMAGETVEWVPGELLVKYKPGVSSVKMETMNKTMGVTSVRILEAADNDWRLIKFNPLENIKDKAKEYLKSGLVQYAELNYISHSFNVPNDPAFTDSTSSYSFNITEATTAWDTITDASSIIVAVVDTGINYNHEDLKDNMWTNPNPTMGDVHGIRIIDGKKTADPMDDAGHGTHVAGIIGARGNNGLGTAGVAWNVQIMACKTMFPQKDGTSGGYDSDIVEGIAYARTHGAKIINLSLGNSDTTSFWKEEIIKCREAGILLVCAAGNHGKNIDQSPIYPASYCVDPDCDNVISVGNSTSRDSIASDSNYGKTMVQLFAPGTDIYSTCLDGTYKYESGTSMAAPFVTGAAALSMIAHPEDDYLKTKNRILNTVDQILTMGEKCATGGRINVNRLINDSIYSISISGKDQVNIDETTTYTCIAKYTDGTSSPVNADWDVSKGDIVKMTSSGELTGLKAGSATIMATYRTQSGKELTATKNITVLPMESDDGVTYSIDEDTETASVAGYTDKILPNITIRSVFTKDGKDYPVTGITSGAFKSCYKLTSVTIPDSVTEIFGSAFLNCNCLTSVQIPTSVTKIDYQAFAGCSSLTNVTFAPDSKLESFGGRVFSDCTSLVSIQIPAGITSMQRQVFQYCENLQNVLFLGDQPEAVSNIFVETEKLSCVYFLEGKKGWVDGATWCDKTTKVYAGQVAPAITTQPVSQSITEGESVTFSVVADGISLAYQWKKDGVEISGATSAGYTIAGTQIADAGKYTVTISNSVGSVTSNEAVLTVQPIKPEPVIPTIRYELKDVKLVLTFTGTLEVSNDGKHWESIDAASPYTVEMTEKKRFFRAVGE